MIWLDFLCCRIWMMLSRSWKKCKRKANCYLLHNWNVLLTHDAKLIMLLKLLLYNQAEWNDLAMQVTFTMLHCSCMYKYGQTQSIS